MARRLAGVHVSFPSFKKIQLDDLKVAILQDNTSAVFDAITGGGQIKDTQTNSAGQITGFSIADGGCNILDGRLFRGVPFQPSVNVTIPHGLGRRAEYMVVSINNALVILRSPSDNVSAARSVSDQKQNMILVTNGQCTADIWCF